ncbi:hypothetical protein NF212_21845 [Parasalinivibrio latis]|uniref:hypothetical protein n=1 Tax=Parasalinivibrio latis TaxID=2952610 RepID=UPI0030E281C8
MKRSFHRGAERQHHFASNHSDGCNRASSLNIYEDEAEYDPEKAKSQDDLYVDLDKAKSQNIEVQQKNKEEVEETNWGVKPIHKGSNGQFPNNRSLRQILSYLIRNPEYGEGKTINVVAESGRSILQGQLRDFLVQVPHFEEQHFQKTQIIWGEINNWHEDKNGTLWLNYGRGDEPSFLLEKPLKEKVMEHFRVADFERFLGAHFILVGVVGKSKRGKAFIKCSMTKYMAFVRRKL